MALVKGASDSLVMSNRLLDHRLVSFISSWLDDLPETEPSRLIQNRNQAFIGDALRGMGFILEPQEAYLLPEQRENSKCLLPYLSGEDLNSDPEQKPSRFVICFRNWDLEDAQKYPDLLRILEERVKPIRDKVKEKREREHWWLFARYRGELRKAIAPLGRVLTRAVVSDTHAIAFMPKTMIFNHKVIVFAFEDEFHFSVLQSSAHEFWMRRFTSTMRTDTNYSISDCFISFPFPQNPSRQASIEAGNIGAQYHEQRQQVMLGRQIGLTSFYNLFHDRRQVDNDIEFLRRLHEKMDLAVLACYGWADIDMKHAFYLNDRKKSRYMPSREAQREIFSRLMALNQEVAAEEAAQWAEVEQDTAAQDAEEEESNDGEV